jgi:L-alanine-DL-glutamate epimerase-like enolase superfamily enzyme
MKITELEVLTVRLSTVTGDIADGAHDNVIVRVHTDEGITGVGEVDAPPSVIKAIIEAPTSMLWARGFKDLILGEDPTEPARIWEKVYEGNLYAGRRGLGINALGAIDMALYDIAGKALGVPAYKLLGGAVGRPEYREVGGSSRRAVVPYASILPYGDSTKEYREDGFAKLDDAVAKGFRAAKMEILYADRDTDEELLNFVAACRKRIGADVDLHVDVGYRWADSKRAIRAARAMEEHNVYFLEAPLHTDNVRGYMELAEATTTRIAVGEMLTTRYEFIEAMDRGGVSVVQPNVGRVGGLTEALRVGRLAHDRGLLCIPHAWKSGISIAANLHLSAALPNSPYFEFMVTTNASDVRRRLVPREFELRDGYIALPDEPGLGVDIDDAVVASYAV